MTAKWNPPLDPHPTEAELIDGLTNKLTLRIEEVADWHYTDAALYEYWDRPLVKLLRFFVGDDVAPLSGTADCVALHVPGDVIDVTDTTLEPLEEIVATAAA